MHRTLVRLGLVLIAALSMLAGALAATMVPANATNTTSTPYTLAWDGITLPRGTWIVDGAHINIKTNHGDVGLHFEAKCRDRDDAECAGRPHALAQYIGATFVPWVQFGFNPRTLCVTWVQVWAFAEHYVGAVGEGCEGTVPTGPTPTPTPTPTVEPTPEPTVTPTPTPEPTQEPTPSPTPTPEPTTTPTPGPTPTPTVEPTQEPSATPTPGATPEPTPTEPAAAAPSQPSSPSPSSTPTTTSEVSVAGPTAPEARALATTGASPWTLVVLAFGALLFGVIARTAGRTR